jgi:general stress protein 26
MEVAHFSEIEPEFMSRIRRIVWCTVSTVDALGRPRSRILHPIWEGSTGWIATGRRSFKAKHIEGNPYVSLSYWDQQHEQVYIDCRAQWEERTQEKQRVWQLFHSTPPPLGYDLAQFFGAPDDPSYGLLKLAPWRIELWSLQELVKGRPPQVWRPPEG